MPFPCFFCLSFLFYNTFILSKSVCVYRPTERERTERLIKTRLREIMMQKDLENVTCKEVRVVLLVSCRLTVKRPFIKCAF